MAKNEADSVGEFYMNILGIDLSTYPLNCMYVCMYVGR